MAIVGTALLEGFKGPSLSRLGPLRDAKLRAGEASFAPLEPCLALKPAPAMLPSSEKSDESS